MLEQEASNQNNEIFFFAFEKLNFYTAFIKLFFKHQIDTLH